MTAAVAPRTVTIGDIAIANDRPLVLLSGPCQIESRDHALRVAQDIATTARAAGVQFVFKSSFDKANRTSLNGRRGIGIDEGLRILAEVRDTIGCPVMTDVHDVEQCAVAGTMVDILQIPAFLSRQTDLLLAAGASGCAVNIKKGQFLAPGDMQNVAAKVASTGNDRILLCERGVTFGYNMLVNDMRALPIMADTGYPVVFDATHSTQQPGGRGTASGGEREFAPALARAAVAVGIAALFAEVHPDPEAAPSDGAVMLPLAWLAPLLAELTALDTLVKSAPPRPYR